MSKTILEPAREISVFDECDVLVVGAGPAGVTAAVAAAKNGARKVVLLERYACLGGMATGGQVLLIPFLSDGKEQLISGIIDEWIDRLRAKPNGVFGPEKSEIGSTEEAVKAKYRGHGVFIAKHRIRYGVNVDPEMLKVVLNELVTDYRITTYCNCWCTDAICEDGTVKGVVFDSKEGRKAILAQVVIDCTGDGDVFASAGADYEVSSFSTARTSNTALVFRIGGVSYDAYIAGAKQDPDLGRKFAELEQIAGYKLTPFSSNRDDVIWFNNWIPRNCMDVRGLTDTAFTVTKTVNAVIDYVRRNIAGMENAYLLDFASQIGTRGSRRLRGTYRLTMDNIGKRTGRDDLIAVMPTLGGQEEYPRMEMPYGILVPERIDGLLAAGRCFSSEEQANEASNWIPHCIALGEAAGTAAALAAAAGVQPRALDVKIIQSALKKQGVFLYD